MQEKESESTKCTGKDKIKLVIKKAALRRKKFPYM